MHATAVFKKKSGIVLFPWPVCVFCIWLAIEDAIPLTYLALIDTLNKLTE